MEGVNDDMNARLRRAGGYGHLVPAEAKPQPPSYDGGARNEPVTESGTPMSDLLHAVLRSARSGQPLHISQRHIARRTQ
jgi:hypothetical protein